MKFEILTVRVYFYHYAFKTGYLFSGDPGPLSGRIPEIPGKSFIFVPTMVG